MPETRRVLMLAFPDCQILDVVGPLQMFAGANRILGRSAYETVIAAARSGTLPTSSGMRLVADRLFSDLAAEGFDTADTVIAAGGDPGLREALAEGGITALIRQAHRDGARIVSVCSGTFFLAAAGVLDGRHAATHWRSVERLRQFRPQIDVDAQSIYVRDGDIWSSAGVTAGIDLALAIIGADFGADVTLAIAQDHVVYPIRPGGQAQFSSVREESCVRDRRLSRLAESITRCPGDDWRADILAAEAGVSLRSLSRLFRKELNASPSEFVEKIRVDRARRALLETGASVETIAFDCGFGSLRRMDRAFARTIAASPSEFRARFRSPTSNTKGEAGCLVSTLAS